MRLIKASSLGVLAILGAAGCASGPSGSTDMDTVAPLDSLDWFNDQISASPQLPDAYVSRAEFHLRNDHTAEAMADYARAIGLDSTRVEDRFRLGELRFDIRDFEGAVREWQGALRVDGQHIPSLLSLAEVDLLLRSYDAALVKINDALRNDDRLEDAYFLKGRLYLETGDTATAASSFQTVVEVNPARYDAYIQLGLLYAAAHDDLALEYFKTARSLKANSIEVLYDEAIYLQEHGQIDEERYESALALYDRILVLDPSNASAAFNKGFVHLEYLNQYDSAAVWFDAAIERLPYYHQAHYNKGLALESMGRNVDALAAYDEALSFAPAYTPAALAKGRVKAAMR